MPARFYRCAHVLLFGLLYSSARVESEVVRAVVKDQSLVSDQNFAKINATVVTNSQDVPPVENFSAADVDEESTIKTTAAVTTTTTTVATTTTPPPTTPLPTCDPEECVPGEFSDGAKIAAACVTPADMDIIIPKEAKTIVKKPKYPQCWCSRACMFSGFSSVSCKTHSQCFSLPEPSTNYYCHFPKRDRNENGTDEWGYCICPPTHDTACDKDKFGPQLQIRDDDNKSVRSILVGEKMTIRCCSIVGTPLFTAQLLFYKCTGEKECDIVGDKLTSVMNVVNRAWKTPTIWASCYDYVIEQTVLEDSGRYMCKLKPKWKEGLEEEEGWEESNVETVEVRTPLDLRLSLDAVNETALNISWSFSTEIEAPVRVYIRVKTDPSDVVYHHTVANDTRHLLVAQNLTIATAYKVTVEVNTTNELARATDYVATKDGIPRPPEGVSMDLDPIHETCSTVWDPTLNGNGTVLKYMIRITEKSNWLAPLPQNQLPPVPVEVDLPLHHGDGENCRDPDDVGPKNSFMKCIFNGLKPNRVYRASVAAVNTQHTSEWMKSETTCVTPFEAPDDGFHGPRVSRRKDYLQRQRERKNLTPSVRHRTSQEGYVEETEHQIVTSTTEEPKADSKEEKNEFTVQFLRPEEDSGPISCFYIAIVPIPRNRTTAEFPHSQSLPPRARDVRYADHDDAHKHNANRVDEQLQAYIAMSINADVEGRPRSYTVPVGTGSLTGKSKRSVAPEADEEQVLSELPLADQPISEPEDIVLPCDLQYLERHKPQDGRLKTSFIYLTYIIARVDLERRPTDLTVIIKDDELIINYKDLLELEQPRTRRSTKSTHAVYGYSAYSKQFQAKSAASVELGLTVGSIVVIVLVTIVLVIVLVAALAMMKHKEKCLAVINSMCGRRKNTGTRDSCPLSELGQQGKQAGDFAPIPVHRLPAEYRDRHRDSDFIFTKEFESLPQNTFEAQASENRDNERKNRYQDIKAFDISRVKLSLLNEDPSSDYINANFVEGYKGRKKFIATQGPKEETVGDFWRMIWEHDCSLIVMVTLLKENYRNQCHKYWPECPSAGGSNSLDRPNTSTVDSHTTGASAATSSSQHSSSATYGQIEVVALEEHVFADYTVRTFKVAKSGQSMTRSHSRRSLASLGMSTLDSMRGGGSGDGPHWRYVTQYHYTGWHDFRAPVTTISFLRFIRRVRSVDSTGGPIVVHCSAGVGRTGTYIAMDAMLEQMAHERIVDIFGFVSILRRQRNHMVQTLEQYRFIYKALAEWYLFGESDIELDHIHAHVSKLRENNGIVEEFEKLQLSIEDPKPCEFGRKASQDRNRSCLILPFDRNRVVLAPIVGASGDSSYINASMVTGYHRPFILAQDPLPDTRCDFWRMVWEQRAQTIVMLSDEHEVDVDEKYWPSDSTLSLKFGERTQLSVQLLHEEDTPFYLMRRLNLANNKEQHAREVVQFVYHCWSGNTATRRIRPRSTSPVVAPTDTVTTPLLHGEPDAPPPSTSAPIADPIYDDVASAATSRSSSRQRHHHYENDPLSLSDVHTTPTNTASLMELIGKVQQRAGTFDRACPIVVCCRTGSYRSGLYCAVSLLLERLKAEHRIDVFQTVKALQAQRAYVLESQAQYEFCYQAVLDYLESFG